MKHYQNLRLLYFSFFFYFISFESCFSQTHIPFQIFINDTIQEEVLTFSYANQFRSKIILSNVSDKYEDIFFTNVRSSIVSNDFFKFYVSSLDLGRVEITVQLNYLYPNISQIDFAHVSWWVILLWIQNEGHEVANSLLQSTSSAMNTEAFYHLCGNISTDEFFKIENHLLSHVVSLALLQKFDSSNELLDDCS